MCKRLLFAACLLACFLVHARGEENNERYYLTIVTLNDHGKWYRISPKSWYMIRMFKEEGVNKKETMTLTLGSDSIVSGKSYVKALCQNEANDTIALLLYRQEGDCVYYLNEAKEEVKILDYSLQQGDIFISADGTEWKVTETGFFREEFSGDFNYDAPTPRMFRLQNREGHEDIWVEGAGSLERGILPDISVGQRAKEAIFVSRLEWVGDSHLVLQYHWGEQGIPTIENSSRTWYIHYSPTADDEETMPVGLWVKNLSETQIGEKDYIKMVMGRYEMGKKTYNEPTDTLYYRQEGSQVYMRSPSGDRDILLFDYSLLRGDIFTSEDGTEWTVTSTSWDSYNNSYNHFYVPYKIYLRDKDGNEDVWIEGAGSELWGILPASVVRESDLVTYPYIPHVRCMDSQKVSLGHDINDENYKYILFSRSGIVTPEQNDTPFGLDVSFQGDTLCIKGKIKWNFGSSNAECEVIGDSIHIILSMNDSYLQAYSLVPSWIDVRIPGFRPGTWHVYGYAAYDGVNHTFDSIEIDTTLTCGNDTGVAPLSVSPEGEKTAVYDLQGRKLNAVPEKGMYIQGGRKVLIK